MLLWIWHAKLYSRKQTFEQKILHFQTTWQTLLNCDLSHDSGLLTSRMDMHICVHMYLQGVCVSICVCQDWVVCVCAKVSRSCWVCCLEQQCKPAAHGPCLWGSSPFSPVNDFIFRLDYFKSLLHSCLMNVTNMIIETFWHLCLDLFPWPCTLLYTVVIWNTRQGFPPASYSYSIL